jgi:hypothetical protein
MARFPVPEDKTLTDVMAVVGYESEPVAEAVNSTKPLPEVAPDAAETPNSSELRVALPSADAKTVALSNVAAENRFSGPSPNCQKLTAITG